ncbi:hypothetical protein [Brucella anthropi]|uniref:hypothetical protein n=1 Tax=Brucella anthropi TaxID=529 RepID=UPI00244927FA|nr:hypothetical protein [Brucella anthropi]MDH0366585.1 hypothetical protein [Brucella anthropi]
MNTPEIQQYSSPDVPEGYRTIISYFMDKFSHVPETPQQAVDDELFNECDEWCCHYANRLGLAMPLVEAPTALKALGIMTLNAYPEALLEIRLIEMP